MKKNLVNLLLILFLLISTIQAEEPFAKIPFNGQFQFAYAQLDMQQSADSLKKDINLLETQAHSDMKSVGGALFYSLLIPGAGQYYVGKNSSAALFLGIEAGLWLGLIGNTLYTDHLRNEYKTYATYHAGVDPVNKGKQYWIDIGKYDDLYAFNEQRLRERRYDQVYDETRANQWQWDSRENRFTYDAKRLQANENSERDVFFWGAIALNHLVSGIHAMVMARRHNQVLENKMSWNIRFESQPYQAKENYFGVVVSAQF